MTSDGSVSRPSSALRRLPAVHPALRLSLVAVLLWVLGAWHIAVRPSDIAKLPEGRGKKAIQKQEHCKASVRAKVEHPFRVIKRQFALTKVRFRGLAKSTAHVITLFALSNLWMARRQLMAMAAVRPQRA